MHLTCAAFISIGLLPLALVTLAGTRRRLQPQIAHSLLAIIAVLAALEAVAPELAAYAKQETKAVFTPNDNGNKFIRHRDRSFPCSSPAEVSATEQMLGRLERDSLPGQRLFVGPGDLRRTSYCDTFIYFLIPKLRPAGYFLEMNPLSANRPGSRLAADVAAADWLVLDCAIDSWREKNRSSEFQSNAPNEVVREKFRLVGQFGSFVLLRRRS